MSTPKHTMRRLSRSHASNPTHHASRWPWALLGACTGLLLASVLWAPARWLAGAVEQATQGQVQLHQARGTVWSGDAMLTLSPNPGSSEPRSLPTRLHWQWGLAPWAQGLRLQLSSACCTPQALQWQLTRAQGRWVLALSDQTSHWPLALLAGLGAPWNTLQADGLLQWHSQGLTLAWQDRMVHWQGQTELHIQNLASSLSTLRPMGSYRIVLQGTENGTATPTLTLSTLSGPLRLVGQGQWVDQRLRFTGEASADEGFETTLSNLLNIIGRREGSRSRLSLG